MIAAGEIGDWPVSIEDRGQRFDLRMIVMRKSEAAAEKERQEIRAAARKKGRSPDPRSLHRGRLVMVVTDWTSRCCPPRRRLSCTAFAGRSSWSSSGSRAFTIWTTFAPRTID